MPWGATGTRFVAKIVVWETSGKHLEASGVRLEASGKHMEAIVGSSPWLVLQPDGQSTLRGGSAALPDHKVQDIQGTRTIP